MYQKNQNPKRLIVIVGCFIFILIAIFCIIFYINESRKTAIISSTVAPSFATITIDNREYKVNQNIKLEPGVVTAKVSAPGFQSKEFELQLEKDETSSITTYLIPDNGDLSWYGQNFNENRLFINVSGILDSEYAANYAAKYPVSTMLPLNVVEVDPTTYDWTEYRIDCGYFEECKNPDFCIKITDTTGGNREKALQKIRDGGFNPNDYEIIYDYVPVVPLN